VHDARIKPRPKFEFGFGAELPQNRGLLPHGGHLLPALCTCGKVFSRGMLGRGARSRKDLFQMIANDPMHHFLPSVTATTFRPGLMPAFLHSRSLTLPRPLIEPRRRRVPIAGPP